MLITIKVADWGTVSLDPDEILALNQMEDEVIIKTTHLQWYVLDTPIEELAERLRGLGLKFVRLDSITGDACYARADLILAVMEHNPLYDPMSEPPRAVLVYDKDEFVPIGTEVRKATALINEALTMQTGKDTDVHSSHGQQLRRDAS